jgi:hypothetical protein
VNQRPKCGAVLVTVPDAIVWHRQRVDLDSVARQVGGYGRGIGARLTSVLLSPGTNRTAVQLFRRAVRRRASGTPTALARDRRELFGLASGPLLYAWARARGRRPRPLA